MGEQPRNVTPENEPVTGLKNPEVDEDTGVVSPAGTVDEDAPTGDVAEPGKPKGEGILRKDVEEDAGGVPTTD